MRAVLALAVLELRRFLADRFNLFFVFVLPLMLVGVLGLQAVQSPPIQVAVTGDGPVAQALTDRLEEVGMEVTAYPGRAEVEDSVGSGDSDLGVVVGSGQDAQAGEVGEAGQDAQDERSGLALELVSVGEPDPAAEMMVRAAADHVSVGQARIAALTDAGLERDEAERAAEGPADREPVTVEVRNDDEPDEAFAGAGQFEVGASGQVLLFVFLNTLGAASAMIQARRSGAVRRGLSAPVRPGQMVTGLALGRLVIALFQAAWIIGMSSLLFGVGWGSLPSVLVVVTLFGLIASGLALVVGVVVDSEGPASGVAVGAGLLLAALGGCMVPLELFTDGLRRVAMFTPHAWAYEALAEIQRRDGGLLDVLPQLGVLAAMALGVLGLGSWLLRRSLARAL